MTVFYNISNLRQTGTSTSEVQTTSREVVDSNPTTSIRKIAVLHIVLTASPHHEKNKNLLLVRPPENGLLLLKILSRKQL